MAVLDRTDITILNRIASKHDKDPMWVVEMVPILQEVLGAASESPCEAPETDEGMDTPTEAPEAPEGLTEVTDPSVL